MQALHNIEKSAFHKGQYVGYGAGRVWRIRKTNSTYGNWVAWRMLPNSPQIDPANVTHYAFTLSSMSAKLAALPIDTAGKLPPVNVLEA